MNRMSELMGGLPMKELIGMPLASAVDAQKNLAMSMIEYVNGVGFESKDAKEPRMLDFNMKKPVIESGKVSFADITFQAPVLGVLPMPSLLVDHIKVDFQMEVTSASQSKSNAGMALDVAASGELASFKFSVNGKISASRENTRSTNQSAKYQICVEANQQPVTECMAKLLDIFATCIEPVDLRDSKSATNSRAHQLPSASGDAAAQSSSLVQA